MIRRINTMLTVIGAIVTVAVLGVLGFVLPQVMAGFNRTVGQANNFGRKGADVIGFGDVFALTMWALVIGAVLAVGVFFFYGGRGASTPRGR